MEECLGEQTSGQPGNGPGVLCIGEVGKMAKLGCVIPERKVGMVRTSLFHNFSKTNYSLMSE